MFPQGQSISYAPELSCVEDLRVQAAYNNAAQAAKKEQHLHVNTYPQLPLGGPSLPSYPKKSWKIIIFSLSRTFPHAQK